MKNTYWVIEPHADDAFLSLDWHIRHWVEHGHTVNIVTVFATDKRAKEGRKYAEAVGANYRWLGYEEQGSLDGEVETEILWPSAFSDPESVLVCPLGLRHDEHLAVRRQFDAEMELSVRGEFCPKFVLYYIDQPYAMQLKNQEALNDATKNLAIFSMYKPGAKKFKKNIVDIFQTQSRFFYFNKDILPFSTETLLLGAF